MSELEAINSILSDSEEFTPIDLEAAGTINKAECIITYRIPGKATLSPAATLFVNDEKLFVMEFNGFDQDEPLEKEEVVDITDKLIDDFNAVKLEVLSFDGFAGLGRTKAEMRIRINGSTVERRRYRTKIHLRTTTDVWIISDSVAARVSGNQVSAEDRRTSHAYRKGSGSRAEPTIAIASPQVDIRHDTVGRAGGVGTMLRDAESRRTVYHFHEEGEQEVAPGTYIHIATGTTVGSGEVHSYVEYDA